MDKGGRHHFSTHESPREAQGTAPPPAAPAHRLRYPRPNPPRRTRRSEGSLAHTRPARTDHSGARGAQGAPQVHNPAPPPAKARGTTPNSKPFGEAQNRPKLRTHSAPRHPAGRSPHTQTQALTPARQTKDLCTSLCRWRAIGNVGEVLKARIEIYVLLHVKK